MCAGAPFCWSTTVTDVVLRNIYEAQQMRSTTDWGWSSEGLFSTSSLLARWRMDVLSLLRMTSDTQQSFDHYLQICWHLRHHPCPSWSRRRLCETPRQGLRPHSLCVPHEDVQKLSRYCASAGPFLIHNNNKLFSFKFMSRSQSVGWVKQKPDNKFQTTRIVAKRFVSIFRPTRYMLYMHDRAWIIM